MPALPPVPNTVKVVITNAGNDGRVADNVYHLSYAGTPPSDANLSTLCTDIWAAWVSGFTPTQPAQTSLTNIEATDLSSDMGAQGFYNNSGTPVPGTSAHGMLPYHTCFLINKVVFRRYRGGHPRTYLPIGTTNDLNDDGDWKESSYAPWVLAWQDDIIGDSVGNTYGPMTIVQEVAVSYTSKEENPVYPYRRATPLVLDIPLDGYSGSSKLATQRRRVRRTERRR